MRTQLTTPPVWTSELEHFVGWLRAARRPDSTVYLRTYHLRRFAVRSGLEPYRVGLDDLVSHLGTRGWGGNTQRSVRSSLRAFYSWAHVTGRMQHNPAALLPTVKAPAGRPRPASERVVKAGLALNDDRVRLMIQLGAHAGLRCCEIAVVHTADVRRDLVGYTLIAHGKGDKLRDVPLTDALARELLDASEGYVFPGAIDGHLSAGYVSKLISRALPEGVTAHMLRHRFGSVAFAAERDIRAVQELLGHASVATTQIYTEVPNAALRSAAMAAAA